MKIGVSLPVREIANDLAASSRHASGTRNLDYRYDTLGNLTSKTSNVNADADVTGYTYSSTKPNALTSVRVGTENLTLTHDTVGNVTAINSNSGEDKAFTYNAHNLATSIRVTNHQGSRVAEETFEYGPDNQRYLKKTVSVSNGRTTTSYTVYAQGGKIERIIASNGYTTKKIRVTGKVTVRTTPSRYPRWSRVYHYALHRDHLGSVYTTTDDNGTAGTAITHDPFGGGRRHDWSRGSTQSERVASLESLAYRYVRTGLTGHEALERTGITHMNGRLYDPVIGRFLNADPYVQSPGFSQSHNRYSYVMNSPTGLVDPSGYRSCQSFGDTGSGDGDSGSTGFGFRITSCPGPTTPGLNPRSILNQLLRAYQNMLRWEATANGQIRGDQVRDGESSLNHETSTATSISLQDQKAVEALSMANPRSIRANREYGGYIYQNQDGSYGYTVPLSGTENIFNLTTSGYLVPGAATIVGDYHAHGDYSVEDPKTDRIIRTSEPNKDHFDADNFSEWDISTTHMAADGDPNYRSYLGTPSGIFKAYDPVGDRVYEIR